MMITAEMLLAALRERLSRMPKPIVYEKLPNGRLVRRVEWTQGSGVSK